MLRLEAPDTEMIYFAYVLDEARKILGVLSLKQLILAPEDQNIKELMEKFPDVEFKGFYINSQAIKSSKNTLNFIEFISISNIKDIIENIEIFIFNNYKVTLEVQLFSKIRESCKNILAFHSNFSIPNYKSLSIKEVEKYWEAPLAKFINHFEKLGFEESDISKDKSYMKSYSKLLLVCIIKNFS